MKIYDVPNFPNPLRVRIALAEKQVMDKVTFVPVDVMASEHRTSQFLTKNPAAGIPVLELDDKTCLSECSAIMEYIDQQFDGISLGAQLELNQNKAWGEEQKNPALNGMIYSNEVLASANCVAGSDFTLADITLFAGLVFADFAGIEILENCANLLAWKSNIANRPSVA